MTSGETHLDIRLPVPLVPILRTLVSTFSGHASGRGIKRWCQSWQDPRGLTPRFVARLEDGRDIRLGLLLLRFQTHDDVWHDLDGTKLQAGIATLAMKYPRVFFEAVHDLCDADGADLLLQCCLFGGERFP